jgi:hypothetical protein
MKKHILFLFSILCATIVSAQNITNTTTGDVLSDINNGLGRYVNNPNKQIDIDGNKYLYDNWNTVGEIHSLTGEVFRVKNLNLNLKTNQFEAQIIDETTKDEKFYVFDSENIASVKIFNDNFVKYMNPKTNKTCFMEELAVADKVKILKYSSVRIKDATVNALTQQVETNAKYLKDGIYFKAEDNTVTAFKPKKKSVVTLFPNKSSEVSDYIKGNKLNVKDENDLVKVFNYYNTL